MNPSIPADAPLPAVKPEPAPVPAVLAVPILSASEIAKVTDKAIAKATVKAAAKRAFKDAARRAAHAAPLAQDVAAKTAQDSAVTPVQVAAAGASANAATSVTDATISPKQALAAPVGDATKDANAIKDSKGAADPAGTPAVASAAGSSAKTDLADLLAEPVRGPWYRRPLFWALVVLVLLIAGGVWWWLAREAKNAASVYSTQVVGRGNVTMTVTANGTLQPTRSINIGSELSGTVLKVNVDVNDKIKKGDVMVVLDTAKLHDQTLRSEATLAAARAKVEQTAATIKEAAATMSRLDAVAALSGGKVPSKSELDTGRATLARARADDSSARAGVSDAQAALSTDQINLSKASIRAPADGVVLTRNVDPGNAVAAALQAVTLFTVAEDLTKLRLWVYVDEADVSAVKVDQDATFTVSAYLNRNFPARITRVGFGSTITDNVVTYLTYLDVANADLSLRPGMTATASIVALQHKDVLLVPNAALRFTPSTAAAGAKKGMASGLAFGPPKTESQRKGAADRASTAGARQVWVLPAEAGSDDSATGVPVAVAVVPGISDGHVTEIISGDLKAGMRVVTAQKTAASK